jgi:uncharacterized protein
VSWIVTPEHLDALEIGAGILGTGGGGNPYLGKLIARKFVEEGARIAVVGPDEVPDDAMVASVGGMGSPTVSIERLRWADESVKALRALEGHVGKRVTHLVPSDNSTTPMVVAAQVGLPVIDGDGMGRAFPELQMETFVMYGVVPTPTALYNHHGHIAIFDHIGDATTLERYARAVTIQMGGSAGYAFPVMTGAQLRETVIPGTLSLAIRDGEAVKTARRDKTSPVAAVCEVTGGLRLFAGKVIDVERRMSGGFARGVVVMQGFGDDTGRTLRIDSQNESLIARGGRGAVLAVVPDLICLIDSDTGAPLTTEVLRYGLRATVIGIPAPVELRTDVGLRFVGPAAFGYHDVVYTPLPGNYANREMAAAKHRSPQDRTS